MHKRTSDYITTRSKIHSKPPKTIEEIFDRPVDIQIFRQYVDKYSEFSNFISFALKLQTYQMTTDEKKKENVFIRIENNFLSKNCQMPVEIDNKEEVFEKIKKVFKRFVI